MTQIHTIEGTWEDLIKNHSAELAGHRVKITILPEGEPQRLDIALADLLKEVEAFEEKPPILSGKNELFDEELTHKYRNQGFEL